jgi:hypothetical protein
LHIHLGYIQGEGRIVEKRLHIETVQNYQSDALKKRNYSYLFDIAWSDCIRSLIMISTEEEKLLKENKDVEPVRAFLLAALLSKSKGDGYNYSQVVNQIRMRQDQV